MPCNAPYGKRESCKTMYEAIGKAVPLEGDPASIIGMDNNDMGTGISGGPWLLIEGGNVSINGINSQKPKDNEVVQQSPYFGIEMYNLWYMAMESHGQPLSAIQS